MHSIFPCLTRANRRFSSLGRWGSITLLCSSLLLASVGARAASVKVEIEGLSDDLQANVAAFLSIVRKGQRKRDKGEEPLTDADVRRLHRGAQKEIDAALQPFGYYAASVDATLVERDPASENSRNGTRWLARYEIDPGPATRIREVNISLQGEGQSNEHLQQLISRAEINPGDVLQHQAYDKLKRELQNDAYGQGYLDGRFESSQIAVHPHKQLADVTLLFDTGPQLYFGELTIEQTILSQTFIDKFLGISAGEVFNPRRLIDLQLALSDSDYFETTEVNVQRDKGTNGQVPVQISTSPSKPRRYESSLGYGTDTGVRGRVSALWRRINQHGHRLRSDIRLSQIQQSAVTRYTIPIGDVRSEHLDFTGDIDQRKLNDVDSKRYSLSSSLNQNRWGGRRRLSLRYQHETWSFGDNPEEQSTLLIPAIAYHRVKADDVLFTRRGYAFSARLSGAAEGLLSDTSFAQALFTARSVWSPSENSRLLIRGEYGATATDNFDLLPPSERFFTGGAQTVRGYSFEELSPLDDNGNRVGGLYLGVASFEMDYLFYGNFGVAAFVDAGNASDTPGIDPKIGAGIGLRYRTPIGMVRVDFAHPFDDPTSSFAFHISLGPDLQ
ncbi:MAG: translocation and assembly module TamA [Halieaceae bacterium]|jgi:translocation and assembly module TamA